MRYRVGPARGSACAVISGGGNLLLIGFLLREPCPICVIFMEEVKNSVLSRKYGEKVSIQIKNHLNCIKITKYTSCKQVH